MGGRRSLLTPGLGVVALASVVGVALWLAGEGDDAVSGDGLRLPDEATVPELDLSVGEASTTREELQSSAPAAVEVPLVVPHDDLVDGDVEPARLVGRITRRVDGTPVTGVLIHPRFSGNEAPPGGPWRALTDDDGRYAFAFPGAEVTALIVAAGQDSAGLMHREAASLTPGETVTRDLRVGAGGSITGRVLDDLGRPVASAQVLAWSRARWWIGDPGARDEPDHRLTVDRDGRFVVPAIGPEFTLLAEADGLACTQRLAGSVADGAALVDLVLRMAPAALLEGRVVDDGGRPVLEGRLFVDGAEPPVNRLEVDPSQAYALGGEPRRADLDDQGRFRLEGVASGPLWMNVEASGFREARVRHEASSGPLEIVLSRGASLTGVVRGSGGAGLPDALVRVRGVGQGAARTDGAGRFEVTGLEADTSGIVAAVGEGHAVHVVQPVTLTASGAWLEVDLVRESPLAGRVVDVQGAPVVGARVEVEGDRVVDLGGTTVIPKPTWERRVGAAETETDAQGRFAFAHLYDGLFELTVSDPHDDGLKVVSEVRSGVEGLEVVLDPAAMSRVVLRGQVLDAVTGDALEHFRLTPMRPNDQGAMSGMSRDFEAQDGRFEWVGLEAGLIMLRATANGFAAGGLPPADYPEGEHELRIELRPERELALRLVDQHGAPREGVSVGFRDELGDEVMVPTGPGMASSSVRSTADGLVRVTGLPAGRVTVTARPPDASPPVEAVYDLVAELPGEQVLVVPVVGDLRDVKLLLMTADHELDVVPDPEDPDGRALLTALMQSGALRPVDGRVTVVWSPGGSGGTPVPVAFTVSVVEPLESGGYSSMGLGRTFSSQKPVARLRVPYESGSLRIEGDSVVTVERVIPPGESDRNELVVLRRR